MELHATLSDTLLCRMVLGRSDGLVVPPTGFISQVTALLCRICMFWLYLWWLLFGCFLPQRRDVQARPHTRQSILSRYNNCDSVVCCKKKKNNNRWSEFRRANVTPNQIILYLRHAPFLSTHIVCKLMEPDLNNNCYSHVLQPETWLVNMSSPQWFNARSRCMSNMAPPENKKTKR